MKISDLKIGVRLGLTLSLVLFLTALITALAIWRLGHVADSTNIMVDGSLKESLVLEWRAGISNNAIRTVAKAKSTQPEDEAYLQQEMDAQTAEITKIQQQLEPLIASAEGKRLLAEIGEKRKDYIAIRNAIFKIKEEKGLEGGGEVDALIESRLKPVIASYLGSLDNLVTFQKEIFKKSHQEVLDTEASSSMMLTMIGVVAIALGAFLSWLLSRSITTPLNYAVSIAQTVASGDLRREIEVKSKDETGQLLQALKDMNGSLVGIVSQVRNGTDTIATASNQIAAGNMDLSSRTEQQASSLEETASSMEELTSTVKQNADNARQANQLAEAASEVASKGGEVVSRVVSTMDEINESSKKIVDIISVIDGIAFQTNILALNAAVEAARAGEQGRGFAVVATEVRSLAQRSASAAKEIKELIGTSVDKVASGSKLVAEAGTTMDEVVSSVKRVTDLVTEISAASQEQSSGIEQVNQAISQMDEVTQQNAALVEEAAAAAQSLQDQAGKLASLVGTFKLDTHAQAPSSRPATTAASSKANKTQVIPNQNRAARMPSASPARNVKQLSTVSGEEWEEF